MEKKEPKDRLEYLRGEIQAGAISYAEIAELQSLREHIEPSDVLLLEWAGVEEFPNNTQVQRLNVVTCGNCGRVFAHEIMEFDEMTCPHCKFSDDVSCFPDFYYPPRYNDSIIELPWQN